MSNKYIPPHKRGLNVKTYQGGPIEQVESLNLAPNEVLLADGRILIRGTLRKDGTKRPDRYKRAKYQNDEDLQRNKYITKGAKRRLIEEKKQKKNVAQNISHVIDNIFDDSSDEIVALLKPLMNDFYNNDRALLKKKLMKITLNHIDDSTVYVSRTEMIQFIEQLLCDKRKEKADEESNQKSKVKGRGNVTLGTGKMLSETIENERKKNLMSLHSKMKDEKDQKVIEAKIKKLKLSHPADALLD